MEGERIYRFMGNEVVALIPNGQSNAEQLEMLEV